MAAENKTISHYIVTGLLSSDGFNKVYQCLDIRTGRTWAIKTISKDGIEESDWADLRAEIGLLRSLTHPNVISYKDAVVQDGCLYVVLECADRGSLAQVLGQFGNGLPEPLVQVYIRQVITGLTYLHSEGVIHRNIQGTSLLLTKEGVVKLTDFRVATRPGMGGSEDVVGTLYWMSPEIIEMRDQTPKCDIWSLGCTTIELLKGRPPYFDLDPMPALFRIVQDDHPDIPNGISATLENFLLECFQKDPNLRPSANELQNNSWFAVD